MLTQRKAKQKRKEERIYHMKQKIVGLLAIIFGVGVCVMSNRMLDGDQTFSICFVALGIWLLLTKQKVMIIRR